ncbi:MAG: hypothetical protein FJY55_02970, partial [Betaproteobacteria bacterium]|nr:hypothetical protein [Betaproteobacteria bacterium]
MPNQIPLVSYLILGDDPHLIAHECVSCKARYFDRRNGCAKCFGTEFRDVRLPKEGKVRAFSIVHAAAPGIKVPFVASVIECGETRVSANIINVEPKPENIKLGMKVRLATYLLGKDAAGTEA